MTAIAYADPPYLGQSARKYRSHPDYQGEVDHVALIGQLQEFDGWALSASSPSLRQLLAICPEETRIAAWVKPYAWIHPTIRVTYAWEPLLFVTARPKKGTNHFLVRDWLSAPPKMNSRVTGEKPYEFCCWLFEILGAEPADEFEDIFRGSGAVTEAWERWRNQLTLPVSA